MMSVSENNIKDSPNISFTDILKDSNPSHYINVGDYVDTEGKTDASDIIQGLINANPNRTLYFRDGTYLLDRQILTPGDPKKSVNLILSNFAILKASNSYQTKRTGTKESWQDDYLYMVSLGGLDRVNDTSTPGSNYSMTGGILDGNGKASGVEIAGGRETRVQNVNMKNVEIGLRIAPGVNSNSSDADIIDINIICNQSENSLGILVDGYDNTITNVRIGQTRHGVILNGAGNMLRNIHPLLCGENAFTDYQSSFGFDVRSQNILDFCYSDNFATAFKISKSRSLFVKCFACWWNSYGNPVTMIDNTSQFNSVFTDLSCLLPNNEGVTNTILKIGDTNSSMGQIQNIFISNRKTLSSDDLYKKYFQGVDLDY